MTARKPTANDIKQFESALRHMLNILNGDIENLENDALGNGASNSKSTVDEGDAYMQEFSLELLERDESTVREIMDALERIESGEFGRCEGCEKWILKERLRAVPYARNCIDCQRSQESNGF